MSKVKPTSRGGPEQLQPHTKTPSADPRSTQSGLWGFLLVLVGGILAAGGGIVTQIYQAHSQRDLRAIELRIRDQDRAVDALARLAAEMNPPLSNAVIVCNAIVEGEADSVIRRLAGEYEQSRNAWRRSVGLASILTRTYFGDSALVQLAWYEQLMVRVDERLRDYLLRSPIGIPRTMQGIATTSRRYDDYRRALDEGHRYCVELQGEQRGLTAQEIIWSIQIQGRRTGSFDPTATLMFTPAEERELDSRRRQRDSLRAGGADGPQAKDTLIRR